MAAHIDFATLMDQAEAARATMKDAEAKLAEARDMVDKMIYVIEKEDEKLSMVERTLKEKGQNMVTLIEFADEEGDDEWALFGDHLQLFVTLPGMDQVDVIMGLKISIYNMAQATCQGCRYDRHRQPSRNRLNSLHEKAIAAESLDKAVERMLAIIEKMKNARKNGTLMHVAYSGTTYADQLFPDATVAESAKNILVTSLEAKGIDKTRLVVELGTNHPPASRMLWPSDNAMISHWLERVMAAINRDTKLLEKAHADRDRDRS